MPKEPACLKSQHAQGLATHNSLCECFSLESRKGELHLQAAENVNILILMPL